MKCESATHMSGLVEAKYVVGVATHIVQVQEFATLSQLSATHSSPFMADCDCPR